MAKFTAGELKVMQLLWEHGEMKPAEIQELYPEPIKNAAMRSYLTILVEKGHITRRQVGKAYFYKAKTLEHRAFHSMLKELWTHSAVGPRNSFYFRWCGPRNSRKSNCKS